MSSLKIPFPSYTMRPRGAKYINILFSTDLNAGTARARRDWQKMAHTYRKERLGEVFSVVPVCRKDSAI